MTPPADVARRSFLGGLVTLALGCGGGSVQKPATSPAAGADAPIVVKSLPDLMSLARLRWLVLVRPREIASVPWLIPAINTVVKEENLNRFAADSGFDLRQLPEAAVSMYADESGEAMFYLARHNAEQAAVERAFRKRLTTGEKRSVDRPDVIRVSGKIGVTTSEMVLVGRDVIGVQSGGSVARGPARVATLYALQKLKRSPTALADNPLKALAARFGSAPAVAFALGPFEGELARGARGLLAGATAFAAAARPSAREGISLTIAVAGDFSKSGGPASQELTAAWEDLAGTTFGHLLGLDKPVEKPLATFSTDAVACAVELDPNKLARGLAAATGARLDEIMR